MAEIEQKDKITINNQTPYSMNLFFKDVRKKSPLSSEEQTELAKKAKQGDIEARDKLIESNQRFIVSIAKEYQNNNIPLGDLINEGNLGLIKSIEKYDENRDIKFLSYAVWWIRQAMIQMIYEKGETVRLPVNRINALNKFSKVKENLTQKLDREPTFEEVEENSDMSENDVKGTLDMNESVSLDSKVSEDSETTFIDFIENDDYGKIENEMNDDALKEELFDILSDLSQREQDIIMMYYGLNGYQSMTLKEIGEKLNLTNERVRQIKENVNKKLRSHSNCSRLKDFL